MTDEKRICWVEEEAARTLERIVRGRPELIEVTKGCLKPEEFEKLSVDPAYITTVCRDLNFDAFPIHNVRAIGRVVCSLLFECNSDRDRYFQGLQTSINLGDHFLDLCF